MKIIFVLLFLLTGIAGKAEVEKVRIHGNIQGLGNEEVVLLGNGQKEICRVKAQADRFDLRAEVETGDASNYALYFPSVGPLGLSMSVPTLYFFIDSPDIEIQGKIEDQKVIKTSLTGSPANEEYDAFFRNLPVRAELEQAYPAYNEAFDLYNRVAMTDENRELLRKASDRLDSLQQVQARQLLALIPQHPDSKVLANIIYNYFSYRPAAELEQLVNQFDYKIRDCYGLRRLQDKIDREKRCEVGQQAPEFELTDLEGKRVKLSSLRGKYTLIDFWASWCGPCRKEIPNLKKVYAEYKDRGLQVVGVSTDTSEKAWRQAVAQEAPGYLQLIDSERITGTLYNYQGIPFIILLSPEGIILKKNLRGTEIREEIARYIP